MSRSEIIFSGTLALDVGLLADDVTGVGVVDDIAIPIITVIGGIAVAGTYIYEKTVEKSDKDRLTGEPGDINKSKNKETKIGEDGRANKERHHTDHGNPKVHTNPHDHDINWDESGNPDFSGPINSPNGAPELK